MLFYAMYATGYATSNAHGCSYCQVHSAATGGEDSLAVVKQLQQARAAEATRNQVTPKLINTIQDLSDSAQQAQGYIMGVEMIVAAFGFLNVFNDLVGLEIEGD